jgi:3-oxoacyl-[acyl-carrier-protein] synthase-3
MAVSKLHNCSIKGIVSIFAPHDECNSDLIDFDAQSFQNRTGISTRKVDNSVQNPIKRYFHQGISKLLSKLKWEAVEVDILICVTQTPDILFPSIATRLHGEFGLSPKALCFDINLGCSGYVYGLQVVMALLNSISADKAKAILCVGDISTRVISTIDTSLRPLFSDAVSVTGIEKNNAFTCCSVFNLETYGSGSEAIKSVYENQGQIMKMNGIDVFNYSFQFVPLNIKNLLEFNQSELSKIDFAIFHQANKLINEAIRKAIGLSENQTLYSIEKYGNTAIASIPLSISSHIDKFKQHDSQVLLCGFGVGFSLASCIITLEKSIVLATFVYDEN